MKVMRKSRPTPTQLASLEQVRLLQCLACFLGKDLEETPSEGLRTPGLVISKGSSQVLQSSTLKKERESLGKCRESLSRLMWTGTVCRRLAAAPSSVAGRKLREKMASSECIAKLAFVFLTVLPLARENGEEMNEPIENVSGAPARK